MIYIFTVSKIIYIVTLTLRESEYKFQFKCSENEVSEDNIFWIY